MNKMLRKIFFVLLALDSIYVLVTAITMFPTLRDMAENGLLMLMIVGGMVAALLAILLLEIVAKVFLLRSTAPGFSWPAKPKGYLTAAWFLFLFNLAGALINVLALGGEGADLFNQSRLALQILASLLEAVAAIFYIRAVKKPKPPCNPY